MTEDDLDDFNDMLQRRGLSADDFELVVGPPQIVVLPGHIGPAPRAQGLNDLAVKLKRTGVMRIYTLGESSSTYSRHLEWVNKVAHDLGSGAFE